MHFHILVVDAAAVDAHGRAGLHAAVSDAVRGDGFGQFVRSGFGHASAGQHGAAHVHQSVQEGAGGDDDAACVERYAPYCLHAPHFTVLDEQAAYGVLPDVQVGRVFQHLAPGPDELGTVALRAGAPHGGTFRAVEQAELDGRSVRHQAHVSAQGVDFADDLSLGDAAHGGVAAHLPDFVHVHGDEAGLRAQAGCGGCGFASGMAGAYHDYVVVEFHCSLFLCFCWAKVQKKGAEALFLMEN